MLGSWVVGVSETVASTSPECKAGGGYSYLVLTFFLHLLNLILILNLILSLILNLILNRWGLGES